MTVEEFIDYYTWEKAKEMQEEMLAVDKKRPKEFTFERKSKDGTVKGSLTIYFHGCPFRLNSGRMVEWLQSFLLWEEASNDNSEFSAEDRILIGVSAMHAQLSGHFWTFDPAGFPQSLMLWIKNTGDYEKYMNYFVWLKNSLGEKYMSGKESAFNHWDCWRAILNSCIYYLNLSLKTGNVSEETLAMVCQLKYSLDECIDETDDDEILDLAGAEECYETLYQMIPVIEASSCIELEHMAIETCRDFYAHTGRKSLADELTVKLNSIPPSD